MGMKLPHAVQSPNMGMWTFDVKEDLVYGDPVLALYFGVAVEEASKGLPLDVFFDAVHPDDLARVQDEIARTCAGQSAFRSEYRVFGSDRKWRRILATGRCFYQNGEPIRYPGFVTEIEPVSAKTKEPLDELSDLTIAAKNSAVADKRNFIAYLLDMVLLEIGRALASRQVSRLMPDNIQKDRLA